MQTIYRTDDGQEFLNRYDAEEYEREWRKREAFRVPMLKLIKEGIRPVSSDIESIAQWITNYRQVIHDMVRYPNIADETVDEALGIKQEGGEECEST